MLYFIWQYNVFWWQIYLFYEQSILRSILEFNLQKKILEILETHLINKFKMAARSRFECVN